MTGHLRRVVADSADRPAWQRARAHGIGASDAAAFAKLESVPLYVRAKLREGFTGNAYTATGHRWEVPALAGAGWEQNTLMFHAADERGYLATPDGIRVNPDGTLTLAEAKAKLNATEPIKIPPAHRRQMWWAQYVLGANQTEYLVLPYDENHTPTRMTPHVITFDRDDAQIRKLRDIAEPVLAAIRAARQFERMVTQQ